MVLRDAQQQRDHRAHAAGDLFEDGGAALDHFEQSDGERVVRTRALAAVRASELTAVGRKMGVTWVATASPGALNDPGRDGQRTCTSPLEFGVTHADALRVRTRDFHAGRTDGVANEDVVSGRNRGAQRALGEGPSASARTARSTRAGRSETSQRPERHETEPRTNEAVTALGNELRTSMVPF
jgi:hypothetical protein